MDTSNLVTSFALKIWLRGSSGDEHPINKAELALGRGEENDVVLQDSSVSGRHAKISIGAGNPTVMDLGSLNGTQLNDQPLPARVLTPFRLGDVITICDFCIGVRPVSSSAPAPTALAERVRISSRAQPGLCVHMNRKRYKHALEKPSTNIGRAADNDITINHVQVSGHHARVHRSEGGYQITDLDSTHGLGHKGRRIPGKLLADGDIIFLCPDVAVQFRAHVGLLSAVSPKAKFSTQLLDLGAQESFAIGRSSQNDLVLNHPQVSRHHGLLERLGGRYRLRDLKSANGIIVNGQKVDKVAWLKEGDEIRIGPFRLIFAKDGIEQLTDEGLRLDVFELHKWVRKDLDLLKEISLSIYPREFVALVGLSGAGKSTLMDAINGFRPATDGVVLVNGDNLYKNFDLYRNDMGYVPQQDIVHRELTVYAALTYAAKLRMPADTSRAERHKRVMEVLDDLDLAERKDLPIHKLSGGQLKRVSIGVELLIKPRLFFLDEPTSGLDPGTEYNMMRLLRRLADQGRTIVLITHATKNVMMCDKVIILVRDGYLAYYGPPEEALTYFDQYRSEQERRVKNIEFDDIYTILEDEARGQTIDWSQRYRSSPQFQENVAARLRSVRHPTVPTGERDGWTTTATVAARQGGRIKRVSALRQLTILSARNVRIMAQDKASLVMMLALAPAIGLMDFIWGPDLFDPVKGDPAKVITMLFMMGLITILVGALSSVREIVKETDIYRRERAINLKIAPYILSKVWVGVLLALYQAAVFLIFKVVFATRPGSLPAGDAAYLPIYITLFLGTLTGYLTGLAISAGAPNQNMALLLVIAVLVPQFLFAGALLPLDLIPGGELISRATTTRWAFEALVNISGMGEPLVDDPCWGDRSKGGVDGWNRILNEANEGKEMMGCTCMGPNLFGSCLTFPGIRNKDFYTTAAQADLSRPAPAKPLRPTPYPSPTPFPSPTPYPSPTPHPSLTPHASPTPYPTFTPIPTPSNPQDMGTYMEEMQKQGEGYADLRQEQGEAYTHLREDQGDAYMVLREEQGEAYALLREDQGDAYTAVRQAQGEIYQVARESQGDAYESAVTEWGETKADWEENRQKAISGAEGLIKSVFESYGHAFAGSFTTRWVWMGGIMVVMLGMIILFQKLKDTV